MLYTTAYVFEAPISTTHTITSAVMGVGATKRLSAVRWGVARSILIAWVLTFPMAGLAAAICYWVSHFFIEVVLLSGLRPDSPRRFGRDFGAIVSQNVSDYPDARASVDPTAQPQETRTLLVVQVAALLDGEGRRPGGRKIDGPFTSGGR